MSATAALTPQPPLPPPPTSQSQILSRVGSSTSPLSKRTSESPRSTNSKTSASAPSPPLIHQVVAHESSPTPVKASPTSHMQSKDADDRKLVSPAPVKLPDPAPPAASSPKEPLLSPPLDQAVPIIRPTTVSPNNRDTDYTSNTAAEQTPAQLALLLSQALADADALRRELASEKKCAVRAERLLAALQVPPSPNSSSSSTEARNTDGRLPESAAKAILEAEARTEKAERARDEALHALTSLSSCFTELERYEAACALRVSDARGAYSRLLTSITSAHPPAQSSPALSTRSPRDDLRLNLPKVPAPFPSLPPVSQLPGPGLNLPIQHAPTQLTRHTRPLPAHTSYAAIHNVVDTRQASAFESLPLPPPPSATGLSSLHSGVPLKRGYSHRGRAEEVEYEEQKRRRLVLDMDVDMTGADMHPYAPRSSSRRSSIYQSAPPSAQPLSAHPTVVHPFSAGSSPPSRNYDRPSGHYGYSPVSASGHHREAIPQHPPAAVSGSRYPLYDDREREYAGREREMTNGGLVRMDARELAREAKARERRGRDRESFVRQPQHDAHPQSESQAALLTAEKGRRRSVSRGSTRSKSSLSLDEMLLETATDGGRGRPSPQEQPGVGLDVRRGHNQGVAQSVNGIPAAHVMPVSPAAQPVSKALSTHGPMANGIGRKSSVPASQLVTLGPNGTIISGGGGDTPAGAAVDPAVRFPGLRTCRQCGQPGRYKEGKCVEKWGPGPQGPGTVCDRCRKKMKRVERRGTLESNSASLRANHSQNQKSAHAPLPLAQSQSSYTQSFAQSQSHSQADRSRAPATRVDTLIIEPERHVSDRSRSPGPGSRYHTSVPAPSAAARHPSLTEQAHYSSHSQSQSRHQAQSRRAPTPPYITALSSREQHRAPANSTSRRAGSEDDPLDDDDRDASRSAARYAHSESYARQHVGEERDELAEDADGDADADADGSGVASADAEDAEADIMDAVDATMKTED